MKNITKEYLLNHKFELLGLEKNERINIKTSGMFSKTELKRLPCSDEDRYEKLNIRISDMIYDIFGNMANFSQKTNLNSETVRKYIRGKSKKTLTKEMLAKFVVACNLSVEEADELFALQDHRLEPQRKLLDAVIVHCLQQHLTLDDFFETCKQVGLNIEYKV